MHIILFLRSFLRGRCGVLMWQVAPKSKFQKLLATFGLTAPPDLKLPPPPSPSAPAPHDTLLRSLAGTRAGAVLASLSSWIRRIVTSFSCELGKKLERERGRGRAPLGKPVQTRRKTKKT